VLSKLLHPPGWPIGLDVGVSSLKMLQFRAQGGAMALRASGEYEFSEPLSTDPSEWVPTLTEGLRGLLASAQFQGRRVAVGLAGPAVSYARLQLPREPAGDRAAAVRAAAAERFDFDLHEAQLSWIETGEVRDAERPSDELLLMAAPQPTLQAYLEALLSAGLRPMALEPMPLALCRCFGRTLRREADRRHLRVIVDIGHTASRLLLLQGQQIRYFDTIEIGGKQFNRAVAAQLELSCEEAAELRHEMSAPEALTESPDEKGTLFGSHRRANLQRAVAEAAAEPLATLNEWIDRGLDHVAATFDAPAPTKLCLVGGEAEESYVRASVAAERPFEVTVDSPLDGVDLSGSGVAIERRGRQSAWAVAAGLALRTVRSGFSVKRGAA